MCHVLTENSTGQNRNQHIGSLPALELKSLGYIGLLKTSKHKCHRVRLKVNKRVNYL